MDFIKRGRTQRPCPAQLYIKASPRPTAVAHPLFIVRTILALDWPELTVLVKRACQAWKR